MNKKKKRNYPKYETLRQYFDRAINTYNQNTAFVELKDNTSITFDDFGNECKCSAYALNKLVKKENVKCAIIAENSIAYMISYFSIILSNNVVVLIAGDLDDDSLTYQINHTDCEVVFVSEHYFEKINNAKGKCKNVKSIITIDNEKHDGFMNINELITTGKNNLEETKDYYYYLVTEPERPCEILFTSGTSGYNKAVVLSNRNVCCSVYSSLENFGRYDNTISVLPFYHAYESACHTLPAIFCGCTNHINDSFTHLIRNLKNTPAEMTVVVPMVLDTIANRIEAEAKKLHATKWLNSGIKCSNVLRKIGIDMREKWFEGVLCKFSPTLRTFVVGGASVNPKTYDLLTSLGFVIINGYGETECAPLIACNTPEKQRRLSVGKVISDMQVKIGEADDNGNGEILVKGKGVMCGYYNDEKATKEVFDENGWLKTGDLGHLNKKGELFICGRSKNLIILSNGKNIYPEELETLLSKKFRYIEEVIISTDEKQTGIYADIYPNKEFSQGKTDEELYMEIKSDVFKFNKSLPTYKYITDIRITREPFKKNINKKIVRSEIRKSF